MTHWFHLAIAIAAEVIGTSFLKSSDGFTNPVPSVAVIVSYAAAFYFLALALRTLPVGIAYAIWAGAGMVLIALAGFLFLGQKLDAAGVIGIGLIIAGVAVINLFSTSIAPGGG